MFAVVSGESGYIAENENLYKPPHGRAVYGGQVIAHAMIVAHAKLGEPGYYCNSIHCYFLLPGDVKVDIFYSPTIMRKGNNFAWLEVCASQNQKEIFRMMISFVRNFPDGRFLGFQTRPRFLQSKLPRPEQLISVDAYLASLRTSIDSELASAIAKYATYPVAVEIRIPHRAFLSDTTEFRHEGLGIFESPEFRVTDKPIVRRMWLRVSGTSSDTAAMLAFLSDWPLLGTSVVPFGKTLTRKGSPPREGDKELLLMASLDHAMWFHGDLQLSGWWLFEMRCLVLGDGRATVEGHMWDASGVLLATLVQEGVVRVISSKL